MICQVCGFEATGPHELGALVLHAASEHLDRYGEALGKTDEEVLAEYDRRVAEEPRWRS